MKLSNLQGLSGFAPEIEARCRSIPAPKKNTRKLWFRNRADAWYEEVIGHPHDPYHRVGIHESSRHVKVLVNGEVVAETNRPKLLFETSLPTRYYIPPEDVREELLVPSETKTVCPYKGLASYYSVKEAGGDLLEDLIWYYPEPLPEAQKVKDHLCFYDEWVDLEVDY